MHTIVDDPIRLYETQQKEALLYLRDVTSWHYLMAERYGQSERATEMLGFATSDERWRAHLKRRMYGADRYDFRVETNADYRTAEKTRPEEVFKPMASLFGSNTSTANIRMILDAKRIVDERTRSDFQRMF